MGLVWLGKKRFLEAILNAPVSEGRCEVCECELKEPGKLLESPDEECIEVCDGCFETRPPQYRVLKRARKEENE